MKTSLLPADSPNTIPHAVDVLNRGGVVAFPTDTVYGLGAMAFMKQSVGRLFTIKGREHSKAIAVLFADPEQLVDIAQEPSESVQRLARRFWPGPLTLVLRRHPRVPKSLAPGGTIGLRMPNHPVALALLKEAGPLGVTSANLSGESNATSATEVLSQLKGRIHMIIDGGQIPGGVPSTVVDMTGESPAILRSGPISEAELLTTLA